MRTVHQRRHLSIRREGEGEGEGEEEEEHA